MINGSLFLNYKVFLKDEIFNIKDSYDSIDVFQHLKTTFLEHGVNLSTQDINSPIDSSFVIFNDYPKNLKKIPQNSYLILWENEVVIQKNWIKKNHKYFRKIFTWDDDLVDNIKYFKIFIPHGLRIKYNGEVKRNFICMISSNKSSNHKNELYSERLNIINWYENLKTTQFQFYGNGWDRIKLNNRYFDFILRKTKLNILFGSNYVNYNGRIQSKSKILNTYIFSFCLENAHNYSGYITEKIFDCFTSLTIPVYKGPPNTLQFIPKECYIDFNKFNTLEDLNYYLHSLSDEDIQGFQNSITTFLNSEKAKVFSHNYFVKTIVDEVIKIPFVS